jgi:hypothetical protein
MSGISSEELMRWRREVWGDGQVSPAEAEALFEFNRRAGPDDGEWSDFFAEALTDYLIRRGEPEGYVTDGDSDWLIERLGRDGRIESLIELNFLDHLFDRAAAVPARLKAFALDAMERIIASGDGPTRHGPLDPGAINAVEAKLLRRFVFAPAGDEPAHVSRAEAEMLWRLKDGALGKDNAGEWQTLFVQAVGNHLLAEVPFVAPDRAEAAARERFMNAPAQGIDRFIARMATARPDLAGAADALQPAASTTLEQRDDGLDSEERRWTEARVCDDGNVDPYEEALLAFVVR